MARKSETERVSKKISRINSRSRSRRIRKPIRISMEPVADEEKGFFNRNLKLSLQYIKESRRFIYFALAMFVFSVLFGYFQPYYFSNIIQKFLKEILETTYNMSTPELIIFILENNIKNAFIGLISGVVLGLIPFSTILINGYFLGYVSFFAVSEAGGSILLRLLPHGIFELPALIISLALGLRFGMFIFSKDAKKEFFYRLDRSLRVFLFVILPLLLIAGIIEGLLIGLLG